jgi:hypothetical protein
MSETPHCGKGKRAATCCNSVKFCYQKPDFSKQILTRVIAEVTEYKRLDWGSIERGGFQPQTALKMQEIGLSCTVEEGQCIQ